MNLDDFSATFWGNLLGLSFKVRSFLEDSCAILISFKSVVIFAEIKTKSAKMTTLLKEMRIAQVSS